MPMGAAMDDLKGPRRLMLAITTCGLLGTAAAGFGYTDKMKLQASVLEREEHQNAANRLRLSLLEAESAIRAYLLYRQVDYIERFHAAVAAIESADAQAIIRRIDNDPSTTGAPPVSGIIERAVSERRNALRFMARGEVDAVMARGAAGEARRVTEMAHASIAQFIETCRSDVAAMTVRMQTVQTTVLALVAGSSFLSGLALWLAWMQIGRRSRDAAGAGAQLAARSDEVRALLRMNEMLQACQTREDIEGVVSHTAQQVLPGAPGSLYVFANSRDRLDRAAVWPAGTAGVVDHFSPSHCWALKRGRPHACGGDGLACDQQLGCSRTLCVPMAARGEVYGVLRFDAAMTAGPDAAHHRRLADALADGVSMALANLSLREKLRGEALRDSLTGLYNRRFLEEVAPAILQQAERRGAPVCVAMLDVDHFKQVNDRYGHATGDALLRCLAATLTAGLRRSDIICRYGGEEFLLLLPDCDLGGGLERLEELRRRVQAMQDGADSPLPAVTASFGLAPVVTSLDEAVRQADEALYAAKRGGRNRVVTSPMLQQHEVIAMDDLVPPAPAQKRLDLSAAMAGDDRRIG